ncbi:hypothetical protein KFL_003480010 [Klebsormidium nitens]|uniref:Acid phosphatase n=2 Tax=Klebsormidium TaxID=3174 RepID=A0A1Y1IF60_KLENI|nr:hypothetical protein KFL_003480010 [Klebsormidium nitens]|eukprot:GAQ87357.1 hypothetical protein KFL_003480010 [Klebsormidium nitens]
MADASVPEVDSEALIKPARAGELHLTKWESFLDSWDARIKTVPSRTIFYTATFFLSTLLLACGALIWCFAHYKNHGAQIKDCKSFFLNIEVGNLNDWVVPAGCGSFVKDYTENGQYAADFAAVVETVRAYVNTLGPPASDGLDLWMLDIDETSLSNVPFFERMYTHWGEDEWTDAVQAVWDRWVLEGTAKALAPTLALFHEMRSAGWQIAFITGRDESQRNVTIENLLAVGYSGWQSLTLRTPEEIHDPAALYKSRHRQELVLRGFRIHGGMGDQWSDLQGPASGTRTFKLPNPMYYVG